MDMGSMDMDDMGEMEHMEHTDMGDMTMSMMEGFQWTFDLMLWYK